VVPLSRTSCTLSRKGAARRRAEEKEVKEEEKESDERKEAWWLERRGWGAGRGKAACSAWTLQGGLSRGELGIETSWPLCTAP